MVETLLVRTDASVAIGTGHAMRCLALAQAWQDAGGRVAFVMGRSTPAVLERLQGEGIYVVQMEVHDDLHRDAAQVVSLAREQTASWVVVDGYQFDAEYQGWLKSNGLKVLLVDDLGRAVRYTADLVLNQNASAREESYRDRETHTRLLLGPRYAMLRREFNSLADSGREIPEDAHRIVVSMGGSDRDNATGKVLEAFWQLAQEDLEVRVVVGGSNPHLQLLGELVQRDRHWIQLVRDVRDMSQLMMWADLAIASAGTISWELCFLGVPAMLIAVADNQRPVAEALAQCGAAIRLGDVDKISAGAIAEGIKEILKNRSVRAELSAGARKLVDGKGVGRVVLALKSYGVQLRRLREDDKELLWKWANDPEVRKWSFSTAQIPWDEHDRWFDAKLRDENADMFLAVDRSGEPVGQIRLDRVRPREAEIAVSVAREQRGKGHAVLLISQIAEMAFSELGYTRLHAFVKPGNHPSSRAFERADFLATDGAEIRGQPATHYVRNRDW